MNLIYVAYAGIDYSNNRIWGYLRHHGEDDQIDLYVFWGTKGKQIKFKWTVINTEFHTNLFHKEKKYQHEAGLKDPIKEEFRQHMLLKKLKGIPYWQSLK